MSIHPIDLKRCQLLTDILKNMMQEKGFISFAQFMDTALFHSQWGYYTTDNFTIGSSGDFLTAPEISPLFAQCFANQIAQIIPYLKEANLLEIGAGTGRFANDVYQALKTQGVHLNQYSIYEKSLSLIKKQKQLIAESATSHPFNWLENIPAEFSGIIIVNEVLDVLPVHLFQIKNKQFYEKNVVWQDDAFSWQLQKPTILALKEQGEKIRSHYQLADGYQSEINLNLAPFIKTYASALKEGIIFLVDYGYGENQYYHPARKEGTLRSFYRHQKMDQPLSYPGLQDITAHVNFTQVIEEAVKYDCTLAGFTTQAHFLLACGLIQLAEKMEIENEATRFKMSQAIKTLTFPSEMGETVKVMGLFKNMDCKLLGFQGKDQSYLL